MKRTIFLGTALLFTATFILVGPGWVAEPGFLKRPLSFQQVTVKDGLSSEMVMAVAAVGEEVWFGTYAGGATLYDRGRNRFKTYTTKGEPPEKDDGVSIKWKNHPAYNHVSVILPDKDRLWFGTYFYGFGGGGISYYMHGRKNPWKRFTTNKDVAKKIVSLAADEDLLYAGSEKGLSVLNKKTEKWQSFYSTKDGLAGNFVNALLLQSDTLWAGTNAGISRLRISQNAWKTYAEPQGLADIEVKSLAKVGEKIWAATTSGALYEYDPGPDRWKKIQSSEPLKSGGINALAVIQGKALVCRDNGISVFEISRNQWDFITKADGLLSSTVFCAGEDKDGIWFGTDQGASRWNRVP